jgi:hypothetical protein
LSPSSEAASVEPTSAKSPATEPFRKLDTAVEVALIEMVPPVILPSTVIDVAAVAWPDSLMSLAVAVSVTLPSE